MVTLTPNGPIENVAIETSNPLVDGEFTLTSQVERVQICTHLQITWRVPIDPRIITIEHFDKSHYRRD